MSGLESGQAIELSRAPSDLVALARDVVRGSGVTERHELEVLADPPELVADVDAGRIERVLLNLVTNAVKYSPGGGRVSVSLARENDQAVVTVRDEGVGIPAADLPHVFERFRRGSNVAELAVGTGIGLAAAKQIVELHGGSIEAQSVEGEGSTFTVRVPLGAAEGVERSSEVEAESS